MKNPLYEKYTVHQIKYFLSNAKKLRTEVGVSATDLSRACSTHYNTVNRWENSVGLPQLNTVLRAMDFMSKRGVVFPRDQGGRTVSQAISLIRGLRNSTPVLAKYGLGRGNLHYWTHNVEATPTLAIILKIGDTIALEDQEEVRNARPVVNELVLDEEYA